MRFTIAASILCLVGCGQDDAVFPETGASANAQCGAWYPGGAAEQEDSDSSSPQESPYGVEEGKIFPCAVWESARLDGQDVYLNLGEEYLAAKHGESTYRSVVVVVSAEGCSQCTLLIRYMAERADDFDAASALMIGMARSALGGDGPDLSLEQAQETLTGERWPVDRWHVINDAEYVFDASFESNNPWIAVISLSDMRVVRLGNDDFPASAAGMDDLLSVLEDLE